MQGTSQESSTKDSLGCTVRDGSPNDLQHWNTERDRSNAVSLVLDLLLEALLVAIYKLLKFGLQQLSKMFLALLQCVCNT